MIRSSLLASSTRGQRAEARRTTILQPVEQKPHSQKDRQAEIVVSDLKNQLEKNDYFVTFTNVCYNIKNSLTVGYKYIGNFF